MNKNVSREGSNPWQPFLKSENSAAPPQFVCKLRYKLIVNIIMLPGFAALGYFVSFEDTLLKLLEWCGLTFFSAPLVTMLDEGLHAGVVCIRDEG